jgi:hypothetical protein
MLRFVYLLVWVSLVIIIADIDGIVFLILLSESSFLMYINTTDVYVDFVYCNFTEFYQF